MFFNRKLICFILTLLIKFQMKSKFSKEIFFNFVKDVVYCISVNLSSLLALFKLTILL
jgi:hypothetical protein